MEKVQESEAHSRTLVDHAPFCIHEIDLSGRFLSVNPASVQMMNLKNGQQLIGVPYLDGVAQEDRDRIQALLSNAYQGKSSEFEFKVAGESPARVIASNFIPRKAPNGITLKIMGISQDITQRKKAEEALQELNLALTHATPGISLLDNAGRYLQVNDAYANMLGYLPAELIGQSWKGMVYPDDHTTAMMAFEAMGATGKGEFEARALRQDGSIFYKHVVMVKRIHKAGEPETYHCFMREITQLKEIGAETLRESE